MLGILLYNVNIEQCNTLDIKISTVFKLTQHDCFVSDAYIFLRITPDWIKNIAFSIYVYQFTNNCIGENVLNNNASISILVDWDVRLVNWYWPLYFFCWLICIGIFLLQFQSSDQNYSCKTFTILQWTNLHELFWYLF